MSRAIPQAYLDLIHEFEQGPGGGFAATPYKDAAGNDTIGWGHRLLPGEPRGPWSAEDAEAQLEFDTANFEVEIERALQPVKLALLTDNQYAAILSLTFNIGGAAFAGSTLCRLINQGQFARAAQEFPRWDHAGGKVVLGLLRRRQAEQALWMKDASLRPITPAAASTSSAPSAPCTDTPPTSSS